MITKVCTRCGKEQPDYEFYEVKYKGKEAKHRYSVCKTCTSIEQKRRYLLRVDPDSPLLEKINELYAKHEAEGRSIPKGTGGRRTAETIEDAIDAMLND